MEYSFMLNIFMYLLDCTHFKSMWQLLTVRQYKGSLYGQGSLKNYQDVFSHQIIQRAFHGSITFIILEGQSDTFLKALCQAYTKSLSLNCFVN